MVQSQKWKKYIEKFFEKKEKKENKEVKEKVKEKEEKDKGVLFVFYNINENAPEKLWIYKKFPKGWVWTGAGSVQPIKGEKVKSTYIREEQFNGPMNKREDMKDYLEKYFAKLKEKKIITKYKIRNRYAP